MYSVNGIYVMALSNQIRSRFLFPDLQPSPDIVSTGTAFGDAGSVFESKSKRQELSVSDSKD
jgi:hypothetical protein